MSKVSEQERRAAARAKRRSKSEQDGSGDDNGKVDTDGAEPVLDPADALRTAASAAIAGAAVGAAKAIARRRQQEPAQAADGQPGDEEPAEAPEEERSADAAADEPVAQEAREPEPQPEPEAEPESEPEPEREQHELRSSEPGEVSRIVRRAREQLRDLRGLDAESVSSIKHTGDGWRVCLDVVELRRVPESTDVLGTYEVDLDDDGNLLAYERTARYHRSEAERR